jgi:hypothetical protein
MTLRRWRGRAAVWASGGAAALLVVGGCTEGSQPVAGSGPVSSRVVTTATSPTSRALRMWAGFPVKASPRPLVLAGPAILDPSSGFRSGEDKIAYGSGNFEVAAPLPTDTATASGQHVIAADAALNLLRTPGANNTSGTTRLKITRADLGSGVFSTDRGPRSLPAWMFTFAGVAQPARVLAIRATDRWPRPNMPSGVSVDGVSISSDGRQVTLQFVGGPPGSGPCGAQYAADIAQTATAVQLSVRGLPATAAQLSARSLPNPNSSATAACTAVGYARTVTVNLEPALGNRVLIAANGAPLAAR